MTKMGRQHSQRGPTSKEFVSSLSDTDLDEIVSYIEVPQDQQAACPCSITASVRE